MCPRTAMKSNMVPPSAALRIDYLSILWVGKCVRKFPPNASVNIRIRPVVEKTMYASPLRVRT
jgi:hypothetical protein